MEDRGGPDTYLYLETKATRHDRRPYQNEVTGLMVSRSYLSGSLACMIDIPKPRNTEGCRNPPIFRPDWGVGQRTSSTREKAEGQSFAEGPAFFDRSTDGYLNGN